MRRATLTLFTPLVALVGVGLYASGCGGTDVIEEEMDAFAETSVDAAETGGGFDSFADADTTTEEDTLSPGDTASGETSTDALALDAPDTRPSDVLATDTKADVPGMDTTAVDTALPDSPVEVSDVGEVGDTGPSMVPSLGAASIFSVLAKSTVTSAGLTVVTGNLGVWPGLEVTGFPPGLVVAGTIDKGGPTSEAAQGSLTTLYDSLKGAPCGTVMTSMDLSGKTLGPGVYCFASSAAIDVVGTLTLDAKGDPNAFWIFQIGSTLTTPDGAAVTVIGGGSACNVFWQIGSSATIGKTNSFGGNLIAFESITVKTGSSIKGRALARNGAVTLDANSVGFSTCP